MLLDDFVMLGKTVPEPTRRDGRVFVCSAGVSDTLRSLVRVYPLARRGAPARWSVNTVKLIRNPEDSRRESFKLEGDRRPGQHERINNAFEQTDIVPPRHRADLLGRHVVGSIKEANAKRLSLAIIHPESLDLFFEHNPDSPDSPELTLFDLEPRPTEGAKRFAYIPRLRFKDADAENRLMLRDWGCFEYMRKHGDDRRFDLFGALHLGDGDCSLLVGNFNQHRNSWLVISVLRGLRSAPSLFDELTEDHRAATPVRTEQDPSEAAADIQTEGSAAAPPDHPAAPASVVVPGDEEASPVASAAEGAGRVTGDIPPAPSAQERIEEKCPTCGRPT